jgi:hypothetical protein
VRENSELTQAHQQSSAVARDKDEAYRSLGEAVWNLVKTGKLTLPSSLAEVQRAVKAAEERGETTARAITDLLDEGSEAADRQAAGRSAAKSGLANKNKKR